MLAYISASHLKRRNVLRVMRRLREKEREKEKKKVESQMKKKKFRYESFWVKNSKIRSNRLYIYIYIGTYTKEL